MKTALIGAVAATTLVATLAWAAASGGPSETRAECLTPADVRWHFERSRSGISLTCNDAIRVRNLARETSR